MAKVSCIGYNTAYMHSDGFHLGDIVLHENLIILNQITVEENPVVLATDKNIYVPSKRQKQFSSTGIDLLHHMAIPTLVVTPGSNTVTDVFGTVCEIFINFFPASVDDLSALNIANVRRIEVYDSPSDPRFRGARKAINFVVQEYAYGGYAKVMASETALNGFANRSNVFNKFTCKLMTYDLYVGAVNTNHRHTGSDIVSQYSLAERVVTSNEKFDRSRSVSNTYPVTFRASLNTARLQVKNIVSFTHESTPEQSVSGQLIYDRPNLEESAYSRNNRLRSNDFNYNGSIFWVHPSDFAIDYSHAVSYSHRNNTSIYSVNAGDYLIDNDAVEDRTGLRFNLYGTKAFGPKHRLRFGCRLIYLNDNVLYPGENAVDNLKTLTGGSTIQYTFSTKALYLSTNIGLGLERIDINNMPHTEGTPFGDVNFSWRMNNKNSVSAYVSYGTWTPGVEMRQDVILQYNELLFMTGNSKLKNYTKLNTNLAYNYAPNNQYNMAVFAGYDGCFNRVATIYSHYGDNTLLRQYINSGKYSHFYIGTSANLKLFNNRLQLYANITRKFFKSTGIYENSLSPVRIQLQTSYYWKSFYGLAYWSSRPLTLTENSNIIIREKPSYGFEAGWGNGSWVVCVRAKNIFRYKWNSKTWDRQTPLFNEWKTIYSPDAHASLNLSISYTLDYGKKTRRGNEVGPSETSPSAIIKP